MTTALSPATKLVIADDHIGRDMAMALKLPMRNLLLPSLIRVTIFPSSYDIKVVVAALAEGPPNKAARTSTLAEVSNSHAAADNPSVPLSHAAADNPSVPLSHAAADRSSVPKSHARADERRSEADAAASGVLKREAAAANHAKADSAAAGRPNAEAAAAQVARADRAASDVLKADAAKEKVPNNSSMRHVQTYAYMHIQTNTYVH